MRLLMIAFCFWAGFAAAQAPFKMPKNASESQIDSLLTLYYEDYVDYAIATEVLEFAVAKMKADSTENSRIYVSYLDMLAFLYIELEQYALADSLVRRTIALAERNKLTDLEINSKNSLAILYTQQQTWDKIEDIYLDIKEQAFKIKDTAVYIDIVANLASYYHTLGDMNQAEMLYQEAIQMQVLTFGKKEHRYLIMLKKLAELYIETDNYQKSLPLLKEVLLVSEAEFVDETFHIRSLEKMANFYEAVKDYKNAEKYLHQALVLAKKNTDLGISDATSLSLDLANLYILLGEYDKAIALYTDFFAQVEQNENVLAGRLTFDIFAGHCGLAMIYHQQGKPDLVNIHLAAALQDASGLAGISAQPTAAWADSLIAFDYASYLNIDHSIVVLATVMEVKKAKTDKLIIADVAIALLQKKRDIKSHDNDKLAALRENYYWLNQIFLLLEPTKDIEKAFALAELNKAVLLLQANNATAAYQLGGLPKELADKEKALDKRYSELEAHLQEAYAKSSRDSLRQLLNKVGIEKRSLRKEIETKYPQYAALKYQQAEPKIAEIQAALPENTALIEYVVLDTATFIFYIDKQNAFLQRANISRTALEYKVKTLHNALSNYDYILESPEDAYANYTQNAAAMYALLLAPVLAEAKNEQIKSLIIVPDGHLAYLPFEAFLSQPAPESLSPYQDLAYLIKDYSLSYSYSAQLWKNSEQAAKMDNNGQILAMAGDYHTKEINKDTVAASPAVRSPKHNSLRKALAPLPAAQEEVQLLSQKFKGHFALGDAASELKFKQQAENYAVIHLAMHGILDEQNPMLSSLAFTEDGGAENNFLQVYEISKMKLNADLVVLSACETGYGKFQAGNGVASLARAFMYAGVNSLVVSLWAVNDASTAVIMRFFYQNLDKGIDKAEALRQAKLQYLSEAKGTSAHPALWSPFIQLGNRKPINMAKEASASRYFLYALAPISGLGLLYFVRRRKNAAA